MDYTHARYAYTSPSETRWYHIVRAGRVLNGYFTRPELARWYPGMEVADVASSTLSAAIGAKLQSDGSTWR